MCEEIRNETAKKEKAGWKEEEEEEDGRNDSNGKSRESLRIRFHEREFLAVRTIGCVYHRSDSFRNNTDSAITAILFVFSGASSVIIES